MLYLSSRSSQWFPCPSPFLDCPHPNLYSFPACRNEQAGYSALFLNLRISIPLIRPTNPHLSQFTPALYSIRDHIPLRKTSRVLVPNPFIWTSEEEERRLQSYRPPGP